ncbi:MAG: acyltransferase family protein [Thermoleophilia bacterium]
MDGVADTLATRTRDYRIDGLRGVAIVLVFLHHLEPWRGFQSAHAAWPYLWAFYSELTCLGVPLFYLVSLYLLAQRADRGNAYFVKRLERLVSLYLIFSALQIVVYAVGHGALPRAPVYMILNGGPGLSVAGPSVFFFLFDLIVLVAVMWAYVKLPAKVRNVVGVAIVVATAALFEAVSFGAVGAIQHNNIANFIIYVPLAVWLASGAISPRLWPAVTVAFVALVAQDLVLHSPFGFSLGVGSWTLLSRLSLPVGALAITTATLATKPPRLPALELAGRYSLGLFAFHKWAWVAFATLLGGLSMPYRTQAFPIVITILAGTFTVLAVWLCAMSPLRPLVTDAPWGRRAAVLGGKPGGVEGAASRRPAD